jgi:phage tail-like protein
MSIENDKYQQGYRFKVTIDEIEAADFTEASGLTVQKEVLEYQEGGENTRQHKLVGATRFSNIVLRRGTSSSTSLFDWIKKTIDGVVQRKNGSIIAISRAGDPIARWDFKNAWPCRYEGPQFRAGETEMSIELIELAHDGFEMKNG